MRFQILASLVSVIGFTLLASPCVLGSAEHSKGKDTSHELDEKKVYKAKLTAILETVEGKGILSYYTSERAVRHFVAAYTGETNIDAILGYVKQFANILTRAEVTRLASLLLQGYRGENFVIEGSSVPEFKSHPPASRVLLTAQDLEDLPFQSK